MVSQAGGRLLVTLGLGLATTALGIGVEVSELRGTAPELAAWAGVGIGLLLTAFGVVGIAVHARRARTVSAEPTEELAERLQAVGRSIVSWLELRHRRRPTRDRGTVSPPWPPAKASRERLKRATAREGYAFATVKIYERRYGADVAALVSTLAETRQVARREAELMLHPRSVRTIEAVALHLIELGALLDEEKRAAA